MRALIPIALLAATPALAHRLDEYLQATIFSIEKNQLKAEMILTPGVAVVPQVLSAVDANGDGLLSAAEQRAYAERVLGDLSLKVDGQRLSPRLLSILFPPIEEISQGQGEIQLDFVADLPAAGGSLGLLRGVPHKMAFENHHQSKISAYQVNCLVPRDPELRVLAQQRNYSQSVYELDYSDSDAPIGPKAASLRGWALPAAFLLFVFTAFLRLAPNKLLKTNRRPA